MPTQRKAEGISEKMFILVVVRCLSALKTLVWHPFCSPTHQKTLPMCSAAPSWTRGRDNTACFLVTPVIGNSACPYFLSFVYMYVQEQRTAEGEAVLRRDPTWTVPLLWRSEFRNALIGLARRSALPLEAAATIMEEVERWLTGHEYSVVSRHVLNLAAQFGCSAYDCEFVTLAQDLRVPWLRPTGKFSKHSPASRSHHSNLWAERHEMVCTSNGLYIAMSRTKARAQVCSHVKKVSDPTYPVFRPLPLSNGAKVTPLASFEDHCRYYQYQQLDRDIGPGSDWRQFDPPLWNDRFERGVNDTFEIYLIIVNYTPPSSVTVGFRNCGFTSS
ncbi:MAG: type II toxin-antitoxin system VapC family toxin [Nitrospira sp.]|nr:type II toxin-antitoxin system VapC family toxin [Nitrospira sp.]